MLQGIRRTSEPGTIAALHAQALAEHGRHSSVAAITEGWQDLPHTRFLVAEEAGTPIAFLAYREEEGGSCHISDLFVCHSRRRRGLARRLLQMVTDDFATISLHVASDNLPACYLYRRMGFVATGHCDQAGRSRLVISRH